MISFSNIELRRGIKLLLSDAELSIHPGQHIGVIGANGSGKSSLFKLLMGEISCGRWRAIHTLRLAYCAHGSRACDLGAQCVRFCY